MTGRYQGFKRRMHQTDGEALLEMFLTALASAFDPQSSYMSPVALENYPACLTTPVLGAVAGRSAGIWGRGSVEEWWFAGFNGEELRKSRSRGRFPRVWRIVSAP
jgi:hypothetical protein